MLRLRLAAVWALAVRGLLAQTAGGGGGRSQKNYYVESKGQDTLVRRTSDDVVVFTTGVADSSEGSDNETDMSGDEEFFHGCLWTFRQQLGMCEGDSCGDAEIMAHDLQRRLQNFYRARHGAAVPPLEEAAWLTVGMRTEHRQELAGSCPGLIITALLLTAEVLTFTGSPQAGSFAREAEIYAASLQQTAPPLFETTMDMFPVQEAWEGYWSAHDRSQQVDRSRSVDIVVSRCSASLQWLWELEYPANTRILIYDKCQRGAEDFREQTAGLVGVVETVVHVPLEECGDDGFMTGECTSYLTHLLEGLRAGTLADFTVFVHDDAPRHLRLSLLSLVLLGMRNGAFDVPFLHLSHERYPAFRTRCLKDVYQRAFGEELPGTLSTYCCAHFVVRRDRIEARAPEFFARLHRLVKEAPYAQLHGGECNIGRKPCYVVEFLWHRVFGEAGDMPLRAEDGRLPVALRYEGGRATRLPSPLEVAPFMALFKPSRYSRLLERS